METNSRKDSESYADGLRFCTRLGFVSYVERYFPCDFAAPREGNVSEWDDMEFFKVQPSIRCCVAEMCFVRELCLGVKEAGRMAEG